VSASAQLVLGDGGQVVEEEAQPGEIVHDVLDERRVEVDEVEELEAGVPGSVAVTNAGRPRRETL
jgi:hypothetical protein